MEAEDDPEVLPSLLSHSKDDPLVLEQRLADAESKQKYVRFLVAALGSIPWVGGLIAASAALHSETAQAEVNSTTAQWLKIHQEKIDELRGDIDKIFTRLEELGSDAQHKANSEEFLSLVRPSFRAWDEAETAEKRKFLVNLLVNSAGTTLCSDDVVRMFVEWIRSYHELHFKVIAEIYRTPGITRGEIWSKTYGEDVAENTAEAGLFRLLIRDLNLGGVIRQRRPVDGYGRFLSGKAVKSRRPTKKHPTAVSSFDRKEPYELSELGRHFVHYTMTDITRQLPSPSPSPD